MLPITERFAKIRALFSRLLAPNSDSSTNSEPSHARFLLPVPSLRVLLDVVSHGYASLYIIVHELSLKYWEKGCQDALRGQRRAKIDDLAQAETDQLCQQINSEYKARADRLEHACQTNQDIWEQEKKHFLSRHSHLQALETALSADPRQISLMLAIGYLSIAILLIVADIPLALNLTQQGFDLDLSPTDEGAISQFFSDPWLVFRANWEVFILTGGVALCSVYIKIFCDRYLIERPNIDAPASAAQRSSPSRLFFSRVFYFTISTFVAMGIFRVLSHEALEIAKAQSDERELPAGFVLSHFPFLHPIITGLTFIFITLLFPLIGGICLSLGLNQIHNYKALKRARCWQESAEKNYKDASEALDQSREKKTNLDGMRNWVQDEKFSTTTAKLLRESYLHGYERGWMDTMSKSFDIVQFAARLRTYSVANQSSEFVNEEMKRGGGV
jgi:hypothetical protein